MSSKLLQFTAVMPNSSPSTFPYSPLTSVLMPSDTVSKHRSVSSLCRSISSRTAASASSRVIDSSCGTNSAMYAAVLMLRPSESPRLPVAHRVALAAPLELHALLAETVLVLHARQPLRQRLLELQQRRLHLAGSRSPVSPTDSSPPASVPCSSSRSAFPPS